MKIFDFLQRKSKYQDNIPGSKTEFEGHTAAILFNYLNLKLEKVATYEELFNLYYTLFCTLDILPEDIKSLELSKEVLAMTFAKLVEEKKIIKSNNTSKSYEFMFNDISDERHWTEQLRLHMIADKWPDTESARILMESSYDGEGNL